MPPPGALAGPPRQGPPPMSGPGRQDYVWHMGMPPPTSEAGRYRDQPPIEWRGPSAPYPPRPGEPAGSWQPPPGYPPPPCGGGPPAEAPPGYPGYHGAHVGYSRDGAGGEADKGVPPTGPSAGAAPGAAVPGTGSSALALADSQVPGGAGAGRGTGPDEVDVREDELPKPPTAAERLKGVPLVRTALSERMLARLGSLGVLGEEPKPLLLSSSAGELGASGEAPAAAAAVRAQCARFGLDVGPRTKLPPIMPGPARLPACTVGLAQHTGLWERFRQRCGTPVSPEAQAPAIPCQLRASGGGGQVVAPVLTPSGASTAVGA